jgi:predicted small integral membrane protein
MTAEDGVDRFEELEEWGVGEWEREVEAPPRPWPAATAGYLVVLAVIAVGLVLMAVVGWGPASDTLFRPGALLVAAGICLAALLRALLSERRAGMLVLRTRRTDVLVYGALGAAAVVLAIVVPPPG